MQVFGDLVPQVNFPLSIFEQIPLSSAKWLCSFKRQLLTQLDNLAPQGTCLTECIRKAGQNPFSIPAPPKVASMAPKHPRGMVEIMLIAYK